MITFDAYSKYYDLLYKDKNYVAEANYVDSIVRDYVENPESMLELGCGTGRFSREFAKLGYLVHGVDLSSKMINEAEKNKDDNLSFSCGDLRTLRLGETYDVVVALFHVLSYQNSNKDVLKMLATIKEHLSPKGIALFDFWYGPAVLTQRPSVKFKEVENGE
ncbi:class I SAM-dependent methyltransferase, partial [Synergistaceae bacterium OttesenSCG-928-I11]|nr:class I SAM-dependent methyltransferase [Synergistaceae bacterium OttesenSCG-928-I11]